jgi:S1-C subfamily serine protease
MVVCAAGGAGVATLAGSHLTGSSASSGGGVQLPSGGSSNPFGGTNPFGGPTGGSSGSGSTSVSASAAAIAAKVDPAVVDIDGVLPDNEGEQEGTGMVISSNGLVLTNNHVIAGTASLTVQIDGTGPAYQAKVVGDDAAADVALVQIENVSNLQTITLGDSSQVTPGESVVAIGNALGKGGPPTVVDGTVTALNQTITASDDTGYGAETLTGLVETDAPIQPGDSGGPVVNSDGQVIAMDTAAQTSGSPFGGDEAPASAAYAIGINNAMTIIHEIEAGGDGNSDIEIGGGALLGVSISSQAATALVEGVESGSPAASAGIAAGDTITGLGGTSITTPDSLHQAMLQHRPGQTVSVQWVDAAGASHSAEVTLASGPPA